ncbi:MAG TPA: PKD domain-containing protein, partial [Ferruginibacter sp.]|nr:PKD domain-containing protein [Ferruginibacter sp.]
ATQYAWYLNGSLISNAANPVIPITQANTNYTIQLIVSNAYACRPDTTSFNFTSRVMPIAAFSINNNLGCTGQLNVVTTNNSQHANSYTWDWGDATAVSNAFNPTHLYTNLGQYQILLTASDGTCTDTTSLPVIVGQKPIVDFDADNRRTCDTVTVHFINLTTFADSYQWVFSNGVRTNDPSPTITFPPSNTPYTVQLIASNNIGCRDSLTKANFIQSIVPPKADFQIDPSATISIPHYTFSFLNLTANNPLYKYQWDLDDGTVAFTRDVLQHQYADTGSYAVQLIVIDTATRCLDTIVKIARIEGYPGYLYVPNAFYPNSLQTQFRSFKPLGKGLAEYVMEIYDSWGKLLFRTDKLDVAGAPVEGWDGTFKGQTMPQDAYAWRIKATFRNGIKWSGMKYNQNENGTPGHAFGTVTLFR